MAEPLSELAAIDVETGASVNLGLTIERKRLLTTAAGVHCRERAKL
jgi:hypothetical protein